MKTSTMIIGAGPAGMACAMELAKSDKKSTIIEKSDKIGGLAKTLEFKEGDLTFRTDIGPHRFFSKNKYLYNFIEKLLGEKWILVPRQTRQFIHGKFYDYPVNAAQAFRNIGIFRSMRIGIDYVLAILQYRIFKKKVKNFEDYIVANFGRSLGRFNMLNYTEKIWGIPCSEINPDWAKQRIQGLNLVSAFKNAVFKKKSTDTPKTLVSHFYYPEYGTGLIYDAIGEAIEKKGSVIQTNSVPTKIKHAEGKITEVEIDGKEVHEVENVVESIPITEFINLLEPAPPKEVVEATNALRWRSQIYIFLTLDKEKITDDNWIYFPTKDIPFGRVAEMKNFSKKMSPEGKTSIFVEYFVFENDDIWKLSKEELYELTMKHFEKLGFFKKEEVRNYYVLKRTNVYPVYDLHYKKHLAVVKEYLDQFKNLYYVGRPGRFKYNNQDHSLEMGIAAARSIIEGKRYAIEEVGGEDEYFEKGQVQDKEDLVEKSSYNWLVLEDREQKHES